MDIITHYIDCDNAEQAAITCRVLTKNNLAFTEEEFSPLSGIRTARFIVNVETHRTYNRIRDGFTPNLTDANQINSDKEYRYNWVGQRLAR